MFTFLLFRTFQTNTHCALTGESLWRPDLDPASCKSVSSERFSDKSQTLQHRINNMRKTYFKRKPVTSNYSGKFNDHGCIKRKRNTVIWNISLTFPAATRFLQRRRHVPVVFGCEVTLQMSVKMLFSNTWVQLSSCSLTLNWENMMYVSALSEQKHIFREP